MKKKILLILLILALVAAGAVFLWQTGFFTVAGSLEGVQDYINRFAPYSQLVYFAVQLASVILAPIPSNITALAGSVVFGFWVSFLLTWSAVVLGSVIVFLLARKLGQAFVQRFVGEKVSAKYQDLLTRKRDVFLAMAFLFPFFPDDVLCILAGLTDISFPRFFVLVLLCRPWGLAVSCAVGSATLSIPLPAMVLLGLVGLAIFLAAMKYGDAIEDKLINKLKGKKGED